VTPVVNMVALLHGTAADMTQLTDAVTSAYRARGFDGAHVVSETTRQTFERLPNNLNGGGVDQLRDVVLTVSDIVVHGGQGAADAVVNTVASVLNSRRRSVADVGRAVNIVGNVARVGGAPLPTDVARITGTVLSAGGNIGDVVEVADAMGIAFEEGGQGAADAVVRGAQAVATAGGNATQVRGISNIIAQGTHEAAFDPVPGGEADDFANDIADAAVAAAGRGDGPAAVIVAAQSVSDPLGGVLLSLPPSSSPPEFGSFAAAPPELTAIVATATGNPIAPLNPDGPAVNAYNQLLHDLESGADKGTIEKDAQQLAIVASKVNDGTLEQVALLIGSGMYGGDAVDALKAASPELADQDNVYAPHITDPLGGLHSPLNDAYLQLEVDVANGADRQKIKADADHVAQVAHDAGQPGPATAATNISNSISDGTYDQVGSLTALMDNPPTFSPTIPAPPSDGGAYQKLLNDIQSGADHVTIITDAAQLAVAAAANGDTRLEDVARNIGNSVGDGTYSADGSLSALKGAVPGTPDAQSSQGPTGQPNDTRSAYLKLEYDVEHGADPQTLKADAEQAKILAQKDGNTNLAAAADAIISGIDNNSYSQVGAEEALMNNGATNVGRGFSPTNGSSSSDETKAYQKLLTDARSGADKNTLIKDVLALSVAATKSGDFGLSEVALEFGDAVRNNMDPSLQPLIDAAPATAAAQFPPATEWTSDPTVGDPAANWS
jgi:hypothetical protein